MTWVHFALLSLLLTGIGNFCFKLALMAGQSPLAATMIVFATDVVISCALFFFAKPPVTISLAALGWPILAGLATGVGILFFVMAMGLPRVSAGVATAIMNVNFILVLLLSWLVFREPITIKQALGLVTLTIGLIMLI